LSAETAVLVENPAAFDLADPATHADLELSGLWRFLRDNEPVYRHSETVHGPEFWVISRHADVQAVYKDNTRFTSERGNLLTTLLRGGDTAAGKMIAVTDGPRQRELRAVLLKAFSPRVLERVAEQVRQSTRRAVQAAVRHGEFDFAVEVADRIPMTTICNLLGVPEADRPHLLRLNKSALSSDDADETFSDAWAARNEILMYFAELAERRRANPEDDVISALATGSIGNRALTVHEIIFNCYSLVIGGDETARLSMCTAVHALSKHKDQWRALRDGEVEMETAVEEVLRWATPAMHFGRVALEDVVLHDRTIAAGDIVTVWNCSANRDERVFDQPDVFDLGRQPNKHVTFGFGPHFCLGSYLARVEMSALLGALAEFAADIEPAGPVTRVRSNFLSGPSRLPVAVAPTAAVHELDLVP
jgi:cytochrome P450